MADVDDDLDGCDVDFLEFAVDEETEELLALFPTGEADEELAQKWRDLGVAVASGEYGVDWR